MGVAAGVAGVEKGVFSRGPDKDSKNVFGSLSVENACCSVDR